MFFSFSRHLQVLFIALFTFTTRFFIPFLPVMVVFASQGFVRVSEDLISCAKPLWRKKVLYLSLLLFLLFFLTPATYTIFQPDKPEALGFRTPPLDFFNTHRRSEEVKRFFEERVK